MARQVNFQHQASASRVSTSVGAARRFLRRQLWLWPVIGAVILAGVGWWVDRSVQQSMREDLTDDLTTILNADVAALKIWFHEQKINTTVLAQGPAVIESVRELVALADKP